MSKPVPDSVHGRTDRLPVAIRSRRAPVFHNPGLFGWHRLDGRGREEATLGSFIGRPLDRSPLLLTGPYTRSPSLLVFFAYRAFQNTFRPPGLYATLENAQDVTGTVRTT